MKRIAMMFSVVALIFAFTTATVSAQKAPEKAKTEKVSDSKVKHEGCSDKAKADCTSGDKAKAGCATPCTSGDKAKAGCCSKSHASAKPVPAPAPNQEKK